MSILFITAGIVFVAEMGDKTQLVAMAFVAKYGVWKVLAGISAAIILNSALAVLLGEGLSRIVPFATLQIIAGLGFLGFGLWSLRCDNCDCDTNCPETRSPFWTVFGAFFVAELGDKTQLVTMGLTTQQGAPMLTFLGASLGLIAAGALGIFLSGFISKFIPARTMSLGAAAIFMLFGTISLYGSLPTHLINPVTVTLYALGLGGLSYLVLSRRILA